MTLRAPFPWFGGKRRIAPMVWERLGSPAVYCEPFAGSLAVLLARPDAGQMEIANDLDGFIANAWRAIAAAPDEVAQHADWPRNENDLHARHIWVAERRADLRARLEADPDYYDARIAGLWVWGVSVWLGGSYGYGNGPWRRVEVSPGDWQLLRVGPDGGGCGVRRGVPAAPLRGAAGLSGDELRESMRRLAARLRRVLVLSGDWRRAVTPAMLSGGSPVAVLLDPPYGDADRAVTYTEESFAVSTAVREWCAAAPTDWRVALCGYDTEHAELESLGWSVMEWTAQGGFQRDKTGGNRYRERVWFSPSCLSATQGVLPW
jgi:hypothetical protein